MLLSVPMLTMEPLNWRISPIVTGPVTPKEDCTAAATPASPNVTTVESAGTVLVELATVELTTAALPGLAEVGTLVELVGFVVAAEVAELLATGATALVGVTDTALVAETAELVELGIAGIAEPVGLVPTVAEVGAAVTELTGATEVTLESVVVLETLVVVVVAALTVIGCVSSVTPRQLPPTSVTMATHHFLPDLYSR